MYLTLGLGAHPHVARLLEAKPVNWNELESCMREISHRTDASGRVFKAEGARQAHLRQTNEKDWAALEAADPSHCLETVTWSTVVRAALLEHFQYVADKSLESVFTPPHAEGSEFSVHPLQELVAPNNDEEQAPGAQPQFELDVAGDDELCVEDQTCAGVEKARPSAWHIVPMSLAPRSKLQQSDVAISVHKGCIHD